MDTPTMACKACSGTVTDPIIRLCDRCRKAPLTAFITQVRTSPFPGSGWRYEVNVLGADGKAWQFGTFAELEDAMDFCEDNGVAIDWR